MGTTKTTCAPRPSARGICSELENARWRSQGNQGSRRPRRAGALVGRRAGASRPRGLGRARRRRGCGAGRRPVHRRRRTHRRQRRGGLCPERDDREGEGAAGGRAQATAPRPGAVHLSAPRARSRADRGSAEERRHGHRLRDRHLAHRHPAAADADVGSRRPSRAAGRRALSRARRGRARRASGRRAGRAAGRGRGAGRRRVGHACRDHRARHGRHGVRGRPLGRGAAPAGGAVPRPAHHLLHPRCARRHPAPRRPSGRRRAGARGRRAKTGRRARWWPR